MTDLRDTLLSLAVVPLGDAEPIESLERRSRRRRRRRIAARGGALVAGVVAIAAAAAGLLGEIDPEGDGRVAATGPVSLEPTTTLAPPGRATVTTASPPTTAPAVCRNSFASSCGPFRWDPEPQPFPLDVRVTADRTAVRMGEEVTFTLEVAGPAGSAFLAHSESGDGGKPQISAGTRSCATPASRELFGPWDLPPPEPFAFTQQSAWTYDTPGTYVARFEYAGGSCFPQHSPVYPSHGEASVTIVVSP